MPHLNTLSLEQLEQLYHKKESLRKRCLKQLKSAKRYLDPEHVRNLMPVLTLGHTRGYLFLETDISDDGKKLLLKFCSGWKDSPYSKANIASRKKRGHRVPHNYKRLLFRIERANNADKPLHLIWRSKPSDKAEFFLVDSFEPETKMWIWGARTFAFQLSNLPDDKALKALLMKLLKELRWKSSLPEVLLFVKAIRNRQQAKFLKFEMDAIGVRYNELKEMRETA